MAQEKLLHDTKHIEINLAGTDMHLGMGYLSTTWSNCVGAVCFYLRDSQSKTEVPIYAIRGTPRSTERGSEFFIRESQPWISDNDPGVTYLSKSSSPKIQHIVEHRGRLLEKLLRTLNKNEGADPDTQELVREDVFLLLFLTFMQKNNVRTFRGVDQEHMNRVYKGKSLSQNYDEVFSRWFTPSQQKDFGWQLQTGSTGCHIPKFAELPAGMKDALIQVFTSSSPPTN